MENSINTYRIRYLKDTSLQTAYVQGKDQEEATKEFLKIFTNIESEKILSVVNIQENQREYEILKIVKIAVSIFIALIVIYGIYFGWNSYKQMSSNEDAKHTYPSYTKQERINTFSNKLRFDSKSASRKDSINLNSSSLPKQKDQQQVQSYIMDDNRLAYETLCSSSDTVVLSCNIKQKILSVCQQKNNKFVYKYGKPHKVELTISSRPLFSHNQFVRANVESRLRFHNKGYNYIVYSNDLFTYDKHPNDGTGVYKAGHGVYVVKNNKLLANIKCTKTYPNMKGIYNSKDSFRHEKYSFLDDKFLSEQKTKEVRKKEVNSKPVNQSQISNNRSFQNTRADTHMDGSKTYYARISKRDHYGKNGQKLKGAGIILQQDRANYHKYHKRDREDTGDGFFDTRANRDKIKRMLARGYTSKKTLDAIRYSTPFVKVKIYPNYIDVTLESGGGQTQQRQEKKNLTQPRQNKSKKSKCSTDGSIKGISSRGDGFVAVRKGPDTKYRMIGKIYRNGTKVKICDRKGKWQGVIYGDCISGSSRSRNGSCRAGWVYGKYIKSVGSVLKKSNNLTNSEKLSLLDQLLNAPNKEMLKYAKVSIREFLNQRDPDIRFVKGNNTYEHTCVKTYLDHFKCKFGAYFDDGEDEGATVVEYDVVRKNNKVKINKIYPVMMAD